MTPKQQALIIQRAVDAQVAKQAENWRMQTVQQMYAIFLTVLHDKHQYSPYALMKVFHQCTELLEDMGIAIT